MLTGTLVRSKHRILFHALLTSTVLILFSGCALTRSSRKTATDNNSNPFFINTDIEDSLAISDQYSNSSDNPAELITAAKKYCNEKNFFQADSLLKIAIEIIGDRSSDSISYEEHLNEILSIYTEIMPPDFQIPEEIVTLAYEQKMFKSLDSMNYTSSDSIFMQSLLCGKSTSYDLPIIWNERVLRAAYYYHKNRKTTINYWIPRASQYLSIMKSIFAQHDLPNDLAYLPLIESGFRPKAYSHAHASGIWQFIPSTGKIYGLRNNYWLDERRDPLKSTIAAARYLKKLYQNFNDWHLAIAAYNCGEGGLSKAISRSNSRSYWELNLPKETMNYVPLFLAALTIAKNPTCFNLEKPSDTATLSFDTVRISECLDLRDIAQGLNINYDTLRQSNPHILHWCTPPDMSNVLLYLPQGYAQAFNEFYATIPDSRKVKWYRYKIKSGDNIGSIARHFKVPAEPIRSINRLKNNRIIAGKFLLIPIPISRSNPDHQINKKIAQNSLPAEDHVTKSGQKIIYQVKAGDSVWRISELFGILPEQICCWNQLDNDTEIKVGQLLTLYSDQSNPEENKIQAPVLSPGQIEYRVQPGDTPSSIARNFSMSLDELIVLNNLDSKNPIIYSDKVLIVKKPSNTGSNAAVAAKKPAANNGSMKYKVSEGETLYGISRIFSIPIQQLRTINHLNESSVIKAGDTLLIPSNFFNGSTDLQESSVVYYEVKQGDNLWRIANSFGIPVQNLYKYNKLNPDSVLMPGDTIKVIRTGEM